MAFCAMPHKLKTRATYPGKGKRLPLCRPCYQYVRFYSKKMPPVLAMELRRKSISVKD